MLSSTMVRRRRSAQAAAATLATMVLLVVLACCSLSSLSVDAARHRPSKDSGFIYGNLPEKHQHSSDRYRKWLKLVRMGYEGGEAERALHMEADDINRASLRLSRDYSGFHGMHCLSKGSCFGDVRNSVFRTPTATSVPVRPPMLQAPPAPESAKERAIDARRAAKRAGKPVKPLPLVSEGVDLSAKLLPKLNAFPARAPRAKDRPLPLIEKHNRADAAVRRSSLAPSKKADMFTALMRSWFTSLQSPFHTRKPGQKHDSYTAVAKPPSDTHAPIVPARMTLGKDGQVSTSYYAPANYEAIKTTAMAAGARHGHTDLDAQAAAEGQAAQDRVRAAPFERLDREVLASNIPVQPRPKHFNYAGAFVRAARSSDFNSAAEQQEAELVAGAAAAEAGTAEAEAGSEEEAAAAAEEQHPVAEAPMDALTAGAEAEAMRAILASETRAQVEAEAAAAAASAPAALPRTKRSKKTRRAAGSEHIVTIGGPDAGAGDAGAEDELAKLEAELAAADKAAAEEAAGAEAAEEARLAAAAALGSQL